MDASSAPKKIGKTIKRARERKRMSQAEAAAALQVSRSALNAWENDRAYPRSSIGAIEELYGIVIDGEPEPEMPELPTPEELNDLRDHIREVLPPDRAARWLAELDAEFGNSLKRGEVPKGAEAARSAGSGRPA